jgi:hypothetical protein
LQALSLVVDFMIHSSRLLSLGIKVLGLAGIAVVIFSAFAGVSIQRSYAQPQPLEEPATTIEPATNTTALSQSNTSSSEIVVEGDRITSTSESNQSMDLDAIRQQYLSVWENTPFSSQFDVFIEEGSNLGYGVYREHVPANIFRPGETIVLYVEPVGFGHQPIITDHANESTGSNNITTLYLINMTLDYSISDSTGVELRRGEALPVAQLISHRQNLEMFLTLALSQEQPFPVGDYILTYVVHDQVTGQSIEIEKRITIEDEDNAAVSSSSSSTPTLSAEEERNSAQPVMP